MTRAFTYLIFSLVFIFGFNPGISAQNYLGIAGGGGLTGAVSFRAAGMLELPVNNYFSFQTEAVFTQRANLDLVQKLPEGRDYRQVDLVYIEFPVLAKLKLGYEGFSLYGLMGVKFGYGMSMRANYVEENSIISDRITFDEFEVQRLDWGINLGAGFEKTISKEKKIFVDYRYYLGLRNINQSQDSEIFNAGSVVNMGFLIPFRLGKEN